jgi:hypothetical protein
MNSRITVLMLGLVSALAVACDSSGVQQVPDVSVVTSYFVHCDSARSLSYCWGPAHRMDPEDFTVIVSRQMVLRANVHPFSKCIVLAPRRWFCMDEDGQLVEMQGFVMRWAELDSAKVAAVSRDDYCSLPDRARGPKPDFWARLSCRM